MDATQVELPSKLEKPVQVIIKMLFNIDIMKNVMKEMEVCSKSVHETNLMMYEIFLNCALARLQIDLQKMPLGKLSKKHIQQAYRVLTTLQDNLSKDGKTVDEMKLIGFTNQFFSLIPHDFGIDNPPLLNDLDLIKVATRREKRRSLAQK